MLARRRRISIGRRGAINAGAGILADPMTGDVAPVETLRTIARRHRTLPC